VDALRAPTINEVKKLGASSNVIYCLVEDDVLIEDPHIRSAQLYAPFEPVPDGVPVWEHRKDDSLLFLEVEIGVTCVTPENMAFLTR
jgi:hypothetical protein